MKITAASLLLMTVPLYAETNGLKCKRVIEVEGMGFVYEPAPKVPTRVPNVVFYPKSKSVTFSRQTMSGGVTTSKTSYKQVQPDEEFEGNSLGFKTERGEALMNFNYKSHGRYYGYKQKYLIGEFYEGDLDTSSWSYLCPLKLKNEIDF